MHSTAQCWVLALAALLASNACMAVPTSSGDVDALKRLSVEWMQAVADKDEAHLQALLAPEFALMTAGEDDDTPRDEWLVNAIKMDWRGFRYEDLRVRVDGDQATIRSRIYFRVSPFPFELDAGAVDTWARRDGRWQVTGRYLGQSNLQDRLRVIAGFLASLVLMIGWWGVRRLVRRGKP